MGKKTLFLIIGTLFFVCLCFQEQTVFGYVGYTTDRNITLEDVHLYIDGEAVYKGNLHADYMHAPYDTFTLNLNIGIHNLEVWLPNEKIRQSKKIFYWGDKYMIIDFFSQKEWNSTSNIFWIDTCNEFPLE